MSILNQSTTNFIDNLATYLEGISALSLVKGTNLFQEMIHETESVGEHYAIYDAGYTENASKRYLRMTWSVRFAAVRDRRDSALESLRAIVDTLVSKRFISITGFNILGVSSVESPEFVQLLENGKTLAACILAFEVIPNT